MSRRRSPRLEPDPALAPGPAFARLPVPRALPLWSLALAAVAACDTPTPSGTLGPYEPETTVSSCDVPLDQLVFGGVGRDGIVALTNPALIASDDPGAEYIGDSTRVVGLHIGNEWVAVPHNVLWYHEVVNFDVGEERVAVTYCPLTGSSLVFDRAGVDGLEFGVSGLLFNNNLILFDRSDVASLWPQMSRRARCGPRLREPLDMVPATEMRWSEWRRLHPDSRVVARPPQFGFRYSTNPLAEYEADDDLLFFPMDDPDGRLPSKTRVLGIPQGGDGGTAYPLPTLGAGLRALHQQTAGGRVVVLWDGGAQGGAVYRSSLGDEELTFDVAGTHFVDRGTGSTWGLDGRATAGPLAGATLEPFAEAYVSFWFAWAAFQPETVVWRP